jgi:hypothetical protein
MRWVKNIKGAEESEAWFVVVYDLSSPHRGPDGCPSVGGANDEIQGPIAQITGLVNHGI